MYYFMKTKPWVASLKCLMWNVECRIGRTLRSCFIESNIWYVFESILQWSMYPDCSSIHQQETLRTQFLASWFQPVSLLDEHLYKRLDLCFSPGHVEYLQIYGNFWYMLRFGLTLCSRRSNLHPVSRGLVHQYWKQSAFENEDADNRRSPVVSRRPLWKTTLWNPPSWITPWNYEVLTIRATITLEHRTLRN